jgi:hypothetical protein
MEALLERDIELACGDGSLPFSSTLLALASPVLQPAVELLKDSQDKVLAMPDGTAAIWTVIRDHVDPRVPHSQKAQVALVGGQGCKTNALPQPLQPLPGVRSAVLGCSGAEQR